MIIILMGVSGSGKSFIGKQLADDLGWVYYEGDLFHLEVNVEKMKRGEPLNDADRAPWLAALRRCIDENLEAGRSAVFACSALKEDYRDVLNADHPEVHLVYLKGDYDTIRARMENRKDHFMKAEMLRSQYEALEEPKDVITVDIRKAPDAIIADIRRQLAL